MLRSILSRVLSRCDREESESGDGSSFRPSKLDASVLYAHGMATERSANEISDLEEQAEEFEDIRENR